MGGEARAGLGQPCHGVAGIQSVQYCCRNLVEVVNLSNDLLNHHLRMIHIFIFLGLFILELLTETSTDHQRFLSDCKVFCQDMKLFFCQVKGQIISKAIFVCLISSKNERKLFDLLYHRVLSILGCGLWSGLDYEINGSGLIMSNF